MTRFIHHLIFRVNRALDELEDLKRQNTELRLVIQALNGGKPIPQQDLKLAPPRDYEIYRRAAENDVRELWFFARAQLDKLIKDAKGSDRDVYTRLRQGVYERKLSALVNMEKMKQNDGYEKWREQEAGDLQRIVHDR